MKLKIKRLLRDSNIRLGLAAILTAILVWLSLNQQVSTTFRDIWSEPSKQSSSGSNVPTEVYQNSQLPSSDGEQIGVTQQEVSQVQDTAGTTEELAVNQEEQKFNDLLVAGSRVISPEKFFAQYRLERDQARGRQVEWVQSIVNNAKTSEETRREAQKKLLTLSDNLSWETQLENMLKAKNYQDALVFVKDGSVTVIVRTPELSKQDVERITDLVSRVTGRKAEEMVIIPKN